MPWKAVLVAALGAAWVFADPIQYSVVPSTQVVPAGTTFSVDLVVSGLTAGVAPSIGAFETTIGFDPTIVAFNGASFGPFLGVGAQALTDVIPAATSVDVAEVSFLSTADLDANHPATYSLVTLNFTALSPGTSPLMMVSATLDDPLGAKLPFHTTDGAVMVTPEPHLGIPAAILTGLAIRRRLTRGRDVL